MYQRNINSMSNAFVNYSDVNLRLASGQVLLRPSDNPGAASQAIIYQSALSDMNQYDTARIYAQNSLGHEDNILGSISNLLTKNLSEKIVQAGNDTYSDADRDALATELEGIRDNLLDLGNSKDSNGRYIFGGYQTDKPPFDENGNYLGGNTVMTQMVGDSTNMQVGHLGSDVFTCQVKQDDGSYQTYNLFKSLDDTITALREPITDDASREKLRTKLDETNRVINSCIDNLGKIQAEVGTNLQQLEQLGLSSDLNRISVESRYQETIGSDDQSMISLITEATFADFALQSSMMVFQTMTKMSLFNMM